MRTWEISRFSRGVHNEPGFNQFDEYNLAEAVNVTIDDDGNLVRRRGCRRLFRFPETRTIKRLSVHDNGTVKTFLTSEVYATASPSRQVFAFTTINGGLNLGTGAYQSDYGKYKRSGTQRACFSDAGFRWVTFRDWVYMTAGQPMRLDTEGSVERSHSGMFRWRWTHELPQDDPSWLEDWGVDSLGSLLQQNPSWANPKIEVSERLTSVKRTFIRGPYRQSKGYVWDLSGKRIGSVEEAKKIVDPVFVQERFVSIDLSLSIGYTGKMPKGTFYYSLTYVREDTLAESEPYDFTIYVPEAGHVVRIDNIPTHPDPTVRWWRLYRNVEAMEPTMRLLAEVKNGETSFEDTGQDLAQSAVRFVKKRSVMTAHAMAKHNLRLWIVLESTGGNLLVWSDPGEPENMDIARNSLHVGTGAEPIALGSVGIQSDLEAFAGALIVFEENATFSISGDPPDLVQRPLELDVGCQAPDSVASCKGGCLWLGGNGVYITDGVNTKRISQTSTSDIEPRLRGVPGSILRDASGVVFRNKYYLAVTDSKGRRVVFVYDLLYGVWTEQRYGFDVMSLSSYRGAGNRSALYAATKGGAVMQLNVGGQDEDEDGNPVAIPVRVALNPLWMGMKGIRKVFRRVYVGVQRNNPLTFRTNVGRGAFRTTRTIQPDGTPTRLDGSLIMDGSRTYVPSRRERQIEVPLGDRHVGGEIEFAFESEEDFSLGSLTLKYRVKELH